MKYDKKGIIEKEEMKEEERSRDAEALHGSICHYGLCQCQAHVLEIMTLRDKSHLPMFSLP